MSSVLSRSVVTVVTDNSYRQIDKSRQEEIFKNPFHEADGAYPKNSNKAPQNQDRHCERSQRNDSSNRQKRFGQHEANSF